jgi:pilus assembly protein CpaB
MKPKTIIPLVVGLVVGFFALKTGLDMVQKARGAQGAERGVVVAAKTIDVASRITENMLTTKKVPASLLPSGSFTDIKTVAGRVSGMTIMPGAPISASMLAPPGSEPGLRAIIPAGLRAVSVSVTEESAVAGFLVPGARVDVFASLGAAGKSKLILSDAEVGAVGQSLSEAGPDGKSTRITKSVTLFLPPEKVEILHGYSVGKCKLRLAMRGDVQDPGESFWSKIMYKAATTPQPVEKPVVELPPPPQLHTVAVRRGVEVETLVFDESGHVRSFKGDAQPSAYPDNPQQHEPAPHTQNATESTE